MTFPALALALLLQTMNISPGEVHPYNQPHYGELYLDDNDGTGGTDITVTTAGNYYGWTSAIAGISRGVVTDTANVTADRLTVTSSGVYEAAISASFSGTNNSTVQCSMFISGVRDPVIAFSRKLGASGDVGVASMAGFETLVGGDYIDLRCTSDSDTNEINLWNVNMNIRQVEE